MNVKQILGKAQNLFPSSGSKILFYHDIHNKSLYAERQSTSVERFSTHISLLNKYGFEIVSDISAKKRQVAIHFDDGYLGVYENFSFFVDHNIPLKIFLIPAYIGKKNYMQANQIRDLKQTGLVTFGSHTYNHLSLSKIANQTLFYELQSSKDFLENLLQEDIPEFCFPRGIFSLKAKDMALNIGYKHLYSSLPGAYNKLTFGGLIRRNLVQFASDSEFKRVITTSNSLFYSYLLSKHFKFK